MVGVGVAFVVALVWSAFSVWLGPRIGLVDVPTASPLKVHKKPTPLLGGVGIYLGLHIGMVTEGAFVPGLFAASSMVLILGLADDRFDLSPKLRLAVEGVAGGVLFLMTDSGMDTRVGVGFTVVLVVVAVNAVNLFDGLDGLVGSVTFASALGLAWAAYGGSGDPALGLTLAAAAVGFLVLNWQPAKVFLGDNGAYLIGVVLAYGILSGGGGETQSTVLLTLGILGVFLIDLGTTISRRALQGKPILQGDRSHLYDQLKDRGWTARAVAASAALAQGVIVVAFVGPMV